MAVASIVAPAAVDVLGAISRAHIAGAPVDVIDEIDTPPLGQ